MKLFRVALYHAQRAGKSPYFTPSPERAGKSSYITPSPKRAGKSYYITPSPQNYFYIKFQLIL